MTLFEWLSILFFGVELGLLLFICWEGWETLKVERANLAYYKSYFDERVMWREAKRQQRAAKVVVNPKVDAGNPVVAVPVVDSLPSDSLNPEGNIPDATKT